MSAVEGMLAMTVILRPLTLQTHEHFLCFWGCAEENNTFLYDSLAFLYDSLAFLYNSLDRYIYIFGIVIERELWVPPRT